MDVFRREFISGGRDRKEHHAKFMRSLCRKGNRKWAGRWKQTQHERQNEGSRRRGMTKAAKSSRRDPEMVQSLGDSPFEGRETLLRLDCYL
jgi:hypothetical protein